MIRSILAAVALVTAGAALADTNEDPISKFDGKPTKVEYVSPAGIFDVERCLIDLQFPLPHVYRQPDRPDDVMIVWGGQTFPGVANSRVDLKRVQGGTQVRSWVSEEKVITCAPKR